MLLHADGPRGNAAPGGVRGCVMQILGSDADQKRKETFEDNFFERWFVAGLRQQSTNVCVCVHAARHTLPKGAGFVVVYHRRRAKSRPDKVRAKLTWLLLSLNVHSCADRRGTSRGGRVHVLARIHRTCLLIAQVHPNPPVQLPPVPLCCQMLEVRLNQLRDTVSAPNTPGCRP